MEGEDTLSNEEESINSGDINEVGIGAEIDEEIKRTFGLETVEDVVGSAVPIKSVTETQGDTPATTTRVCFSSIWILVAIIPIVVFILLYFIEPGFIQKREGNMWIISNNLLWGYWALFTFVNWVLVLMYVSSRGYKSNVEMCV